MQVETVRCCSSISGTLCIPLGCCFTRGKEWSCDRGLFYEGGYIYLDSRVSFQAGFRTSVISGITRFGSRNWLIERVLKCECMVIETRLRCSTHDILENKGVSQRSHGATTARLQRVRPSYHKHLCLEQWKPVRKTTSELNLTEDNTSKYTQYHLCCMGLS